MRRAHAVRQAWVDLQRAVLDELRGAQRRVCDRYDLIVVAVHDQYGDCDGLQVLGEVRFRERFDALVVRVRGAHHALAPPVVDQALRDLCARAVEAVEGSRRYVAEELRAILEKRGTEAIEDLDRRTLRILRGLDHDGRNGADQYDLCDSTAAVPRSVARGLSAASRMPNMNRIFQIELLRQLRDIGSVGIHVVTGRSLRRAAMTATIVSDDAIALPEEEQHLRIPLVG